VRTLPLKYPVLTGDLRCDVVVTGAGLTGAAIAHALVKNGFDVVVIDKRGPGQGSTAASTALALYEIDIPLFQLIRTHGARNAVASYRCCLDAIFTLRDLDAELDGSSQLRMRPSLYVASTAADVADLRKEFRARNSNGFSVEFIMAHDLKDKYGLNAPAAIWSEHAAEVNPLQLTLSLVAAAKARGARVFAHTSADALSETKQGVAITTSAGHRIHAQHLIIATGYETDPRTAARLLQLRSTYVIVTQPLRGRIYDNCPLIWETARPYVYIRSTPDNRLMIGGGDEPFLNPDDRDRLLPKKTKLLQQKLTQLFPGLKARPTYAWAGTFGETVDGLPFIGRAQPRSRLLYALCCGANGTNFAIIAAEISPDLLCGKRNPHANLFAFDR
jgi:glycine/D-amino acid oxidase-like deaminating enzyme